MLSVICPIYNEEKYIAQFLDSLLQQDYPKDDLEILLVDGMSKDRTREIVAGYTAKYPFIRLIDNPDKIVPYAMNRGIFGNNNINTALIENSKINRFDIHCYGRDIAFKNVEFFDLYNQYSSVFGTINHDHCTFTNFVPVLNGGSYNAFVGHDIVFDDCVFNATEKKNCIIKLSNLGTDVNERKELSAKALPNVRIKNLTVNMTEGADYLYLFYTKSSTKEVEGLDYLSSITIDGMTVVEDGTKPFKGMALNNVQLKMAKPVDCTVQNVEARRAGVAVKSTKVSSSKAVVVKANMPLKGGKMVMKNVRGLKQ